MIGLWESTNMYFFIFWRVGKWRKLLFQIKMGANIWDSPVRHRSIATFSTDIVGIITMVSYDKFPSFSSSSNSPMWVGILFKLRYLPILYIPTYWKPTVRHRHLTKQVFLWFDTNKLASRSWVVVIWQECDGKIKIATTGWVSSFMTFNVRQNQWQI